MQFEDTFNKSMNDLSVMMDYFCDSNNITKMNPMIALQFVNLLTKFTDELRPLYVVASALGCVGDKK